MQNIGYGFRLSQDDTARTRSRLTSSSGEIGTAFSQVVKTFDPKIHLTLRFGSKKMDYINKKTDKLQQNWGQIKLFSCLMDFLTLYYKESVHHNPKLVYVGAAPGQSIPLIMDMFPKFKFVLYDSQPFDELVIERAIDTDRVEINQRYFNDQDVERFSKEPDIFFMSDIRSLMYNVKPDVISRELEELVWGDMQLQQDWVTRIKPVWSHLKFRPPYYSKITLDMFGGNKFEYLAGTIFYQNFVKPTSSETRLVVSGNNLGKIEYDFEEYEKTVMYHNAIVRNIDLTKFYSPMDPGKILNIPEQGFLPNWDVTKFLWLVKTYLIKIGREPTEQLVIRIVKKIESHLIERAKVARDVLGIKKNRVIGFREMALSAA